MSDDRGDIGWLRNIPTWAVILVTFGVGIVVIVIVVKGLPSGGSRRSPDPTSPSVLYGDEYDARVMAKDAVKSVLKYPHDAEFSWLSDATLGNPVGGHRHWLVTGQVTAANAFGAHLTHDYKVTLKHDDGIWTTLIVTLGDETLYVNADEIADALGREKASTTQAAKPSPKYIDSLIDSLTGGDDSKTARPLDYTDSLADVDDAPVDDPPADPEPVQSEPPKPEVIISPYVPSEREPEPVVRTWTSTAGTETEAEFVSYASGKVRLKKADGSFITVPLDKLSEADRKWIKGRRKN